MLHHSIYSMTDSIKSMTDSIKKRDDLELSLGLPHLKKTLSLVKGFDSW